MLKCVVHLKQTDTNTVNLRLWKSLVEALQQTRELIPRDARGLRSEATHNMIVSEKERELCRELRDFPRRCRYRWNGDAKKRLLQILFFSLAQKNPVCLQTLFGEPRLPNDKPWVLREYQGAEEGSEYSSFARGKPCGHIFKSGEATYRCKTCTADDTCVLCSKCFEASDHSGHVVYVSISPGNSGCCDCGDDEAWLMSVHCAIHTGDSKSSAASKRKGEGQSISEEWAESIRMTIGRALDYICDVISCSPEQLRLKKSEESIRKDEFQSRLVSKWYDDENEESDDGTEWALILWNDEKHSVQEVQEQVARACRKEKSFGLKKAQETDDIGRSVVIHSRDLKKLMEAAAVIEKIKITVTIRSARDTFREQMCSAIIEWLLDIVRCHVGSDNHILQETVCKELLKPWRTGSKASNANVGRCGIDDHELEESQRERMMFSSRTIHDIQDGPNGMAITLLPNVDPPNAPIQGDPQGAAARNGTREERGEDPMELDSSDADLDMRSNMEQGLDDDIELTEATRAEYPPPPAPAQMPILPQPGTPRVYDNTGDPDSTSSTPRAIVEVPKSPFSHKRPSHRQAPPAHWIAKAWSPPQNLPLAEDVWQRVRLDWLILFDLRLWKKTRIDLRDLYISTVVTVPAFKHILGLRFAGLYPVLAQLYLIADREPDHSIVYLSIQMLTTPSITQEVVEKGNFLTNLFAILYTFLTTRQVGHPWEIAPDATLAFDTGSVTNRRMYHFFMDIRHLFALDYICAQLQVDRRYHLQFLDLIKLPQGICPNRRAIGEHVEYETDTWISASILTRELHRLCRLFAEAFKCSRDDDFSNIASVIRTFVRAAIINSTGAERYRFRDAEIMGEIRFKDMRGFGFNLDVAGPSPEPKQLYNVVDFVVERESISFHHALHYTISWLIEGAKSMGADQLQNLIYFTVEDLREGSPQYRHGPIIPEYEPECYLMAFFDFPLRVCAWLAQMKAGMWVRNGLSLRHQMSTYRGVAQRDLAHHRDIFLLQTALVTCNPSRVLLSMIDRFELNDWMIGRFVVRQGYEGGQMIDIAEDFIHLLIVLLIERTSLVSVEDDPNPQRLAVRRDIIHILCFKPLSFSDLCNRLADKFQDLDDFQEVLEEMTVFKPPEGLSDSGTFELKQDYLAELDPFILHYNKNQRDESEAAYRSWVSKTTGKPASEIVLEPNIRPITTGLFRKLGQFVRTEIFTQVILSSFRWALTARLHNAELPVTRVEAFLQVLLHLVLAGVLEDEVDEEVDVSHGNTEPMQPNLIGVSFIRRLLSPNSTGHISIISFLHDALLREDLASCHQKIRVVLLRIQQKSPPEFANVTSSKGIANDRLGADSPMNISAEDVDAKKRQALDRQAKVMAQFQKQQQAFLNSQVNIDWGDDIDNDEEMEEGANQEHSKTWRYPGGNCILCQEETNENRFYGTFALFAQSRVVRQTDIQDEDYLREVIESPQSLDRFAGALRPYGVAGQNRHSVKKISSNGLEIVCERQALGKGFKSLNCREGPVSVGCGHIMHYDCFEHYCNATVRRQTHQIARNHPERLDRMEFVCPLCKALGNAFLPTIWKGKNESYPGILHTDLPFNEWLESHIGVAASRHLKQPDRSYMMDFRQQEMFAVALDDTVVAPSLFAMDQSRSDTSDISVSRRTSSAMPGGFPNSAFPTVGPISEGLRLEELVNIYRRICDTIRKNGLESRFGHAYEQVTDDLVGTDVLATTLGYSIAATEIAQRGVESEPGSPFLNKIPALTLTNLRILSETTSAFISAGGLKGEGDSLTVEEYFHSHRRQLLQIFAGHPQIYEDDPWVPTSADEPKTSAALAEDPFTLLTESSVFLVPALRLDVHHIVCLLYIMEMVKAVLSLHCSPRVFETFNRMELPRGTASFGADTIRIFTSFLYLIESTGNLPCPLSRQNSRVLSRVFAMVSSYTLTFLRKTAILLHVRYGVDFPNYSSADVDGPEADRLARLMRLPTISELLQFVTRDFGNSEQTVIQNIVGAWVRHWRWMLVEQNMADMAVRGLRPSHPCILELIGLPKYYDSLIEETMRRQCPSTSKELVEPSICLFCGDIFCSQAVCCTKDGIGGCNQHMSMYVQSFNICFLFGW